MKIVLLLVLISGSVFGACSGANGYTFCQDLTLDHTKVPSNQSNYPAAICFGTGMGPHCLTNSKQLATAAHGGFLQDNANGFDFILTSDSAGITPLNYEAAIHNLTTGETELWVLLPSISSTVDLTIYLFYGNAGVTTDQSNATAVWDANYLAVHHFTQTSGDYTGTIPDSTTANPFSIATSGFNSPPNGYPGPVGGGVTFGFPLCCGLVNTGPYSNFPPTVSPAPFTLEGWFNTNGQNAAGQAAYCFGSNSTDGDRWGIAWDGPSTRWIIESQNRAVKFSNELSGWHRIVTVLPSGQTTLLGATVYVDGVLQTVSDITGGGLAVNPQYVSTWSYAAGVVCNIAIPFAQFTGFMDELRLSKIERSQDWITTDYNNQSNVAAFWSQSATPGGARGRTIIIN